MQDCVWTVVFLQFLITNNGKIPLQVQTEPETQMLDFTYIYKLETQSVASSLQKTGNPDVRVVWTDRANKDKSWNNSQKSPGC